jgi:glycosyltransferase involved in cell wall biosynthesis
MRLNLRKLIWELFLPVRLAGGFRNLFKTATLILRSSGIQGVLSSGKFVLSRALQTSGETGSKSSYVEWITAREQKHMNNLRATQPPAKQVPLISIVMPVFQPKMDDLRAAVNSVSQQSFSNWELILVDDFSPDPIVHATLLEFQKSDSRVRVHLRDSNGHISTATNDGVRLSKGAYVAFLDQDDLLAPFAIEVVTRSIQENPGTRFLFSDEDKIDDRGRRFAPHFKPSMNPELALAYNFFCHLSVYEVALLNELEGFRSEFDGAQDYDLALRAMQRVGPRNVVHIPLVLYHWRASASSTASGGAAKPYARLASILAASEALKRAGVSAKVEQDSKIEHANKVTYLSAGEQKLSIIIPTRDKAELLEKCLESVYKSNMCDFEVIVIDNGSSEERTFELFTKYESPNFSVIRVDAPFNYSSLCNKGAQAATGSILCFMNNDIEVLSTDWSSEMSSLAALETSGAVGARLWYPDKTLQHAGVVVGIRGSAGHAHKHLPAGHPGYASRAMLRQNFSAVTGACLVVEASKFAEVGGFDERFAVGLNDIDLCLKLLEKGYWNIWTPYAEMIHHESASRGKILTPIQIQRAAQESALFAKTWNVFETPDPFYNRNLTLDGEDFDYAW